MYPYVSKCIYMYLYMYLSVSIRIHMYLCFHLSIYLPTYLPIYGLIISLPSLQHVGSSPPPLPVSPVGLKIPTIPWFQRGKTMSYNLPKYVFIYIYVSILYIYTSNWWFENWMEKCSKPPTRLYIYVHTYTTSTTVKYKLNTNIANTNIQGLYGHI